MASIVHAPLLFPANPRRIGHNARIRQAKASRSSIIFRMDSSALNCLAQASSLAERSPRHFEDFIREAAEDGPVERVFIDGNVLMQSGLADQVASVSPSVSAQLAEAVATGGAVQVPVGEWAARIVPQEGSDALIEHLRTEADGLSVAEAQEAIKNEQIYMQEEIDRAVAQADDADVFEREVTAIRDALAAKLDAAGRFAPSVNAAYADFVGHWYATMAQRTGMTPVQLYESFPLRIVADAAAQGQSLEQAIAEQPPRGWKHATTGEEAAAFYEGSDDAAAVFFTDLAGKLAQDAPEISGFSHSLNRQAAEHILKNHGDEATEQARGQLAVRSQDIARIPEIVTAYDGVRQVRDRRGDTLVAYAKLFDDGVTVYFEGITRKRQNLRGVSMRRYPPSSNADTILQKAVRDEINARSERGIPAHEASLTEGDQELNQGGQFNQSAEALMTEGLPRISKNSTAWKTFQRRMSEISALADESVTFRRSNSGKTAYLEINGKTLATLKPTEGIPSSKAQALAYMTNEARTNLEEAAVALAVAKEQREARAAQNAVDRERKSRIAEAFSRFSKKIATAHHNRKMAYKSFAGEFNPKSDIVLHRSPGYGKKPGSFYFLTMVDGKPAYLRESDGLRWRDFEPLGNIFQPVQERSIVQIPAGFRDYAQCPHLGRHLVFQRPWCQFHRQPHRLHCFGMIHAQGIDKP